MERIAWLINSFGFTYRQLSDIFPAAPSLLHRFQFNKRKLPAKSQTLLSDSLFNPYAIEDEMAGLPPPPWQDPDEAMRQLEMEVRFKKLTSEIHKANANLESFKKQHQQYHTILYHTRHLPYTSQGNETLVELWWIVIKAKTRATLYSFTLVALRKKELKIALMQEERLMLGKWIEEDKIK